MDLNADYLQMLLRLLTAVGAGACIGYERSFHGRPAGLRTHVLVCLASAVLMLVTVYEDHWVRMSGEERLDPTRMAQGIMTGIGFLGAGAIIKDGLSVRGLTTAASIWITAAIGILTGVGFYFAALVGTVLTLGTLSTFRWIEARLPTETYSLFMVRFAREAAMAEPALRSLVQAHGFSLYNLSYRLHGDAGQLEYRMVLRTMDAGNARSLAEKLKEDPAVLDFRIAPTSD